jgi:hypothetical protein
MLRSSPNKLHPQHQLKESHHEVLYALFRHLDDPNIPTAHAFSTPQGVFVS